MSNQVKHESFCPKCGAPIQHELQFEERGRGGPAAVVQRKLVPAFSPCPSCHVLLKVTGLPFFEQVEPESAPVAVYAQYKRYIEAVTAKQLADAKASGPRVIM